MPGAPREAPTPFPDAIAEPAAAADKLFDLYLDAALAGTAEDPATFLKRHPGTHDGLLLSQLAAVHAASTPADGSGPEEQLPRRFGDFILLQRLGAGGMGVVFLAQQPALDRMVALKVIQPEFARSTTAGQRFDREAKAIARLRHPNIVTVYAAGETGSVRYIAMELIAGVGLDEALQRASESDHLPIHSVLRWLAEIAEALAYAHQQGIVHRDVKPSNIRITPDLSPDSRAMLVDFGLARDLGSDGATLTEAFVGSPFYVAPEQIGRGGGDVDGRTDVYSLGVVLYQCLVGRPPFAEGTLEHVLHQILVDEPIGIRQHRRDLPRELAVVVHKAIEKAPDHRYATAADFAADLRAVLEFRPIAAQPPGMLRRASKWARRNVAAAAVGVTALTALIVLAAILVGQQIALRAQRGRDATAALDEARSLVHALSQSQARTAQLEAEFEFLQGQSVTRFFSDEEQRALDRAEDEVSRERKDRERNFHRAIEVLSRAERLGAAPEIIAHVRGELYLASYLQAVITGDPVELSAYRDLVRQNDPTGSLSLEMAGGTRLTLTSDPPGASVYLYRMADLAEIVEGGDRRMVPVPLSEPSPVTPGSVVARIRGPGAGSLRENDLIIEIDGAPVSQETLAHAETGGVEAKVWSDGSLQTTVLPSGLTLRRTAAPLAIGDHALVGLTPLIDCKLDGGDYVALLRADDRQDQRIALRLYRGNIVASHIELHAPGAAPDEFVRVIADRSDDPGPAHEAWIMEREVTMGEYFEFLNDPATLAEIDASPEPIRMPRSTVEGIHAPRGADGRFGFHPDWTPDWPVFGISWIDANAYARWKTRRAQEAGLNFRFELPTLDDWVAAAAPCVGCTYPFGNRFRHKWVSSCFSRAVPPNPEPVLGYPIDESRLGIYDLCGSMSEWLSALYLEDRNFYWHASGSWGHGKPEAFRVYAANGMPPDRFSDTIGFRLVLRQANDPPKEAKPATP